MTACTFLSNVYRKCQTGFTEHIPDFSFIARIKTLVLALRYSTLFSSVKFSLPISKLQVAGFFIEQFQAS